MRCACEWFMFVQDINMDSDATTVVDTPEAPIPQPQPQLRSIRGFFEQAPSQPPQTYTTIPPNPLQHNPEANTLPPKETFREIAVKVHIRKPDKDSWVYLGRGLVTSESVGRTTRIVVRSISSQKVLTAFGEAAALQAEKRGNFVVVSCVEGPRVVSWSLNALNNSETLRLLAIIELSCYSCKQVVNDPQIQNSYRRRIARAIKDDRRKRHKRRKDADSMVAAFAKTGLDDDLPPSTLDM
ncbi:hypothetical protein BXZ70DRAFT_298006 [Cristinia sonorae]|uniref:Uncharacterized protein n=1 Tax=Cristinia sonorae TaxID=1940300 RepID=A0A8K0XNP6_9AGAR|nr:hypothetical protein BXZ70DRAFT_298006 [Cristinia sonorae]